MRVLNKLLEVLDVSSLLMLICRWPQGHKEIFTEEFLFCSSYLTCDAWAYRYSRESQTLGND